MIIQHIRAENILKYHRLALTNLPAQGLIAISGANESGKTAIGETLCLALFGRTFSLPGHQVKKIIRWGAIHASVTVDFTVGAEQYQIARYFDAEGQHSVRLTQNEQPISQDADEVQSHLNRLMGFNYPEFIDSFYLAQREITLPHPQGDTVKDIVGINALERVARTLQQEISQHQAQKTNAKTIITSTNLELMELNLDETKLDQLKLQHNTQEAALHSGNQQCDHLRAFAIQLQEQAKVLQNTTHSLLQQNIATVTHQQWHRYFGEQHQAVVAIQATLAQVQTIIPTIPNLLQDIQRFNQGFAQRLALFDAVEQGATAYRQEVQQKLDDNRAHNLLAQQQQLQHQQTRAATQKHRNQWVFIAMLLLLAGSVLGALIFQLLPEYQSVQWGAIIGLPSQPAAGWLWGSSAVLAIFSFITSTWVTDSNVRMADLNEQAGELQAAIATAHHELAITDNLYHQPLSVAINHFAEASADTLIKLAKFFNTSGGAVFVNPAALADFQIQLTTILQHSIQQLNELAGSLQQSLGEREQHHQQQRQQLTELAEMITDEHLRRHSAAQLKTALDHANQQINTSEHAIRVRDTAITLITGTCKTLATHFNQDLKAYVSYITPKLTENRYEYLQLDDQLQVKIFSPQKNDFLNFEEVSSGTQRQITLAVRIALSEALIAANIHAPQFMILDEPFAFFDPVRIRNALKILPTLSQQLTQIWVVSQEFAPDAHFDLHIQCDRSQQELIVG